MGYKIDLLSLRKFSKLYNSIREDENQIFSSVFLNLKKGLINFSTSYISGVMKVTVKDDPTVESDDEFFLPGNQFFAIVDAYAEVSVVGSKLVAADGDFDLAPLKEKWDFPNFDQRLPNRMTIPMVKNEKGDASVGDLLTLASSFSSKDTAEPYCGVFIKKGRVIGTDRFLFFDYALPEGANLQDVGIPLYVWSAVASLPYESLDLSWDDDGHFCVRGDKDECIILSTSRAELDAPDPSDPNFRASFAHEAEIVAKRSPLLDMLRFFEIFTQSAPNNRMKLSAPSKEDLRIDILDKALAHRSIKATVDPSLVSEKEGDIICLISAKNLLKALETVGGGENVRIGAAIDGITIDIRLDEEKPEESADPKKLSGNHISVANLED